MKTSIIPYLTFSGRCQEALDFYTANLGAMVLERLTFSESPDPLPEEMTYPGIEEKIMHATLKIGESSVMMSDGCSDGKSKPQFAGFWLSLAFSTEAEAHGVFDLLADGGTIAMPLNKTFWSPCFGMLTDRFGLGWMVNVVPDEKN